MYILKAAICSHLIVSPPLEKNVYDDNNNIHKDKLRTRERKIVAWEKWGKLFFLFNAKIIEKVFHFRSHKGDEEKFFFCHFSVCCFHSFNPTVCGKFNYKHVIFFLCVLLCNEATRRNKKVFQIIRIGWWKLIKGFLIQNTYTVQSRQ